MPNENLQIVVSPGNREGQKILRLKGSLNIQTIFGFQSAVRAENSPVVILDFSGVPFIDSAGLGALVGAYVAAQKKPQRMASRVAEYASEGADRHDQSVTAY